jgi:DNA-binding HxlR family transcriptional regulator
MAAANRARWAKRFAIIVINPFSNVCACDQPADVFGRTSDIDLGFRSTSTYLVVRMELCEAGVFVMRRKHYYCGLEAALDVIGGKWKVLILWALRADVQRFGELRRSVGGISEKMLIQHLKEMQADGIVVRKDFKEVPPRVEYALTPFGKSLYSALAPLCEWGTLHMNRIEARKEATEGKIHQRAVA